MKLTKLMINCEHHGKQLAVSIATGEIWCSACQNEYWERKSKGYED